MSDSMDSRIEFDHPQWRPREKDWLIGELGADAYEDPVDALEARIGFIFGRSKALVVPTPSLALFIVLAGLGIGANEEVIASPFSWYGISRAVALSGATLRVSDIDAWSFTLDPEKVQGKIGNTTRAILVSNTLGHPAAWDAFEKISRERSVVLIEDATESLFSEYRSRRTGTFGDVSILAFGSPHPNLGESYAAILTDRDDLDRLFRSIREKEGDRRLPPSVVPLSIAAEVSEGLAQLALLSLSRLPAGLKKKALVLEAYQESMRSFEGVKDLYQSPEIDRVTWLSYMVHLGTRFSVLSRNAIVEDLVGAGIGARIFPEPIHLTPWFLERGYGKGMAPIAEKLADRAIALPLHPGMNPEDAAKIIERFKEAATNVGAGAAIY